MVQVNSGVVVAQDAVAYGRRRTHTFDPRVIRRRLRVAERQAMTLSEDTRSVEADYNLCLPGVEMKCLSMGMTDSYKIAIEEGANLVRVGTGVFGERV